MKSLVFYTVLQLLSLLTLTTSKLIWPTKKVGYVPGDLLLAGFFPVHEIDHKIVCGKIEEEGVYQLETFLYIVDEINNNPNFLPGIKLGVFAEDGCDSDYHTLEVAMDLVTGFMASDSVRLNEDKKITCSNGDAPEYHREFNKVVGVIGGRSSRVSIQLANLLRIFKIPQVSFKSNNPQLSDKKRFEYFFRTVAPIVHQSRAMIEVLKAFNWKYVSVVYSDSAYGNEGFGSLLALAENASICFATQQRVNVETFKDEDYDKVLSALVQQKANAVLMFGEQLLARSIFAAAERAGHPDRFVFIGSEAWGSRTYATKDNERAAEGVITVGYLIKPPDGYIDYFKSLRPDKNRESNPWFYEFWEEKLACRLEGFDETPHNMRHSKNCSINSTIPDEKYMNKMPSAQLVRDAVYSVAHALNGMHRDRCNGRPGLCDEMKNIDGKDLKEYLKKVAFEDTNGYLFQFDENGDAPPIYSIVNFQKVNSSNQYEWRTIGTYVETERHVPILQLRKEEMQFKHHKGAFPESICSLPCRPGETQVVLDKDSCCWTCFKCTDYEYLAEGKCEQCPLGTLPNSENTFCEKIPITYMSYSNPWSITALIFAILGMLVTILVGSVFWKYWETPIVKASGRDLSALLLIGIFFSFALTFVIVAKPSTASCGFVRFFLGFFDTLCYAAILSKARRIARIFDQKVGKQYQKPKYTSPKSQMMITAALVSIEGVIIATWFMHNPPSTIFQYPTPEEKILICKGSDSGYYLVGLIYPVLLMVASTIYAFKTRKCPDGFNEAKYITFTNYTTCIIWLAFLPTFMLSESNAIRTTTLSLLLNLSATVQLICLFLPKVNVAVRQPERNTKNIVMGYRGRNTSSTDT